MSHHSLPDKLFELIWTALYIVSIIIACVFWTEKKP